MKPYSKVCSSTGATLDECVVNFIYTIKTIINGRLFPPRTNLLTFKILKISDGFDNACVVLHVGLCRLCVLLVYKALLIVHVGKGDQGRSQWDNMELGSLINLCQLVTAQVLTKSQYVVPKGTTYWGLVVCKCWVIY